MGFSEMLASPIGGSGFFKWGEALWLPRWKINAVPQTYVIQQNIEATAVKMNLLREFFGTSIMITSWYRPNNYNALIGGAAGSAHQDGLACDFLVQGQPSDEMREALRPHLKEFNIRLENLATPHLHIDLRCAAAHTNEQRYFTPNARLV